MYTKQAFIDSVSHDFNVIKHLAEKIPEGTLGYKPSENQRTTLELLQYLASITSAAAEVIRTGDMSLFGTLTAHAKDVTLENFAKAIDTEETKFKESMERFTDEDLKQTMVLFGGPEKTKAAQLVDGIGKWLPAYKMQLFLYIKASGASSLGTANVWGGFDMPPAK